VFKNDKDPDKYDSLLSQLREKYKSEFSPACVYYKSSLKQHIYLDKKNSWKGEYTIEGTQESIELSVRQEESPAVHLRIHTRMQNGIESSSAEVNNYKLLLGHNCRKCITFWMLPKPTRADHVDPDYLLCKFVQNDGSSKENLMKKIRTIMKA